MKHINISKMDDVHGWINALPQGKVVEACTVAKHFNLASAAVAGRFIASSDRPMTKIKNGVYLID
jgi:hypothetical protein